MFKPAAESDHEGLPGCLFVCLEKAIPSWKGVPAKNSPAEDSLSSSVLTDPWVGHGLVGGFRTSLPLPHLSQVPGGGTEADVYG